MFAKKRQGPPRLETLDKTTPDVKPSWLIVLLRGPVSDPFRAIRQFERLLFRGVPEHPEPTWQRDSNEHVSQRMTGRPASARASSRAPEQDLLVARVVYDFTRKETRVIHSEDHPGAVAPTDKES